MSALARDLQQQIGSSNTMDHVVNWGMQLIPGAQHISISLVDRRRRTITSAAATSEVAHRFNDLQQEVDQGPCLDAMYHQQTLRVDDLASETRWPALAARRSDLSIRSALCLQLFVQDQNIGALNVLSEQVRAFNDESEHWGLLVASHAAIAVASALKIEGLNQANVNRTVIGQAEGILIERFKISPEAAFALLARISQDTNRKLYQVAQDLVRTGNVSQSSAARKNLQPHPR